SKCADKACRAKATHCGNPLCFGGEFNNGDTFQNASELRVSLAGDQDAAFGTGLAKNHPLFALATIAQQVSDGTVRVMETQLAAKLATKKLIARGGDIGMDRFAAHKAVGTVHEMCTVS